MIHNDFQNFESQIGKCVNLTGRESVIHFHKNKSPCYLKNKTSIFLFAKNFGV